MKTTFKLFSFLCVIVFFSCSNHNNIDESPDESSEWLSSDTIVIQSVTPSTQLQDGDTYTFKIDVKYNLANIDSALIMVGFNSAAVNSYVIASKASLVITKESATHTFTVITKAKNWGNEGEFNAYINMSKYPHPETWVPITADRMALDFMN